MNLDELTNSKQESDKMGVLNCPTEKVPFKSGRVALIGRPNVGKSTLLNQFVQLKLSGVSPKPQTTRHNILGIVGDGSYQVAFLDTPGMIVRTSDELNRHLVSRVAEGIDEADLVVLVIETRNPVNIERMLVESLVNLAKPAILAINKIDLVKKHKVLPVMEQYAELYPFLEIMPISALHLDGIDKLLKFIVKHLPCGDPMFEADELTDRTEVFLSAQLIQEKVFQTYEQEVPYASAVQIDTFREVSAEHGGKDYISATIYVERVNQRKILIGRGGQTLKKIGIEARRDIEEMLGRPVHLDLWVKVKSFWRKDEVFLKEIGY